MPYVGVWSVVPITVRSHRSGGTPPFDDRVLDADNAIALNDKGPGRP